MGVYCDLTGWLGEPYDGEAGVCGDACPADTSERCVLERGHAAVGEPWHRGVRLRWRRD